MNLKMELEFEFEDDDEFGLILYWADKVHYVIPRHSLIVASP